MEETYPILDFAHATTLYDFMVNLLVALLCGLAIALVYRLSVHQPGYSSSFAQSLVLLSLITAIVILVIGNNLARAFGLVGAMSIIRFRTAVRQVQDIVFIFFSLAMGLAAGVGLRWVALIGTAFVSIICLLLGLVHFGRIVRHRHLLVLSWGAHHSDMEAQIQQVFTRFCRKATLLQLRTDVAVQQVHATWVLHLHKKAHPTQVVHAVRQVKGIEQVQLVEESFEQDNPLPI